MWRNLLLAFNVIFFSSLLVGRTCLHAQIHADFSAQNVSGCSPITVNFTNISTGATTWQWDLGNGTISNLKEPSATYISPGKYTVKLTAINGSNKDVITKTDFIIVYAGPIVAFGAGVKSGCYPLSVPFTDQSIAGSGNIVDWQWDFGDGNISSQQNPTHVYKSAGQFNVILTVKNSNGCIKTLTKPNLINTPTGVAAFFNNTVAPICTLPAIINFYNGSTGDNITNYDWDFGDGTTGTGLYPMHVYTSPGIYDVSLTASTSQGCSNVFTIKNDLLIGVVKADFTMPTSYCAGARFALTNTSLPTNGFKHVFWTFSDGTSDTVSNPKKIFANPGVYTVTLFADYGSCSNTVSKTITILPKATPSFSANVTAACAPPLKVTFTNTSTNGNVIDWDFGDGTTSNQINPTHNFVSAGDFSVMLTASNANGCTGTTTLPGFIHIGPPKIAKINGPFQGCIPYTANFIATIEPAAQAVNYQWDFGDGSNSTQTNPSHVYSVEGIYDVKLGVTAVNGGCSDTFTFKKAVTVGTKPSAAFSATPLIVCQGESVDFADGSSGGANQYLWFFGDSATSKNQNPEHSYANTGYYSIKLVAYRNGCADTSTKIDYIKVTAVDAVLNDSFLCNNQYQHFFTSKFAPDSNLVYKWDFGDGTTSLLQNPIHSYTDTGSYNVVFTTNSAKCRIAKRLINVINVLADFIAADSAGCGSTVERFTVMANPNYLKNYFWDFGDGSMFTNKSLPYISHEYAAIGNYPVKLQVTDLNNCPINVAKTVSVKKYAPKPNFTVTKNACANTLVTFEDKSQANTDKIIKWVWDFGDGTGTHVFTDPPFTHRYTKGSVYDVTLTVYDATGCSDSLFLEAVINIGEPTAYFIAATPTLCLNTPVQFYNGSSNNVTSWQWSFGDGSTSVKIDPQHTYKNSGTYDVSLIVKDDIGCIDTFTRAAYINIGDAKAIFSMSDSVSNCPPLLINFTNQSTFVTDYLWDFGDSNSSKLVNPSHTYTSPGSYIVKLLVSSYGGCSDTMTRNILIGGPKGSFKYSPIIGCTPLAVNFQNLAYNAAFYTWDFDDGFAIRNTNISETHTYALLGTYLPRIILEDSAGCKVPIYGLDSIKVKGVEAHVQQLPLNLICDSGIVAFKDSAVSNDTIKSFLWSFGDGQTSSQENPIHKYVHTGIYKASYVITTAAGCTSSDTLKVPVKVVTSPKIAFVSPVSFCVPANIKFNGQWLNPDSSTLSWKWDFGNGIVSSIQNPPSQTYNNPGSYSISSIAMNASGCTDTVIHTLTVFSLPIVDAGPDKLICLGNSATLNATGALTYIWKNLPSLSCLECPSPIAKPSASQLYVVMGTNANGCTADDSVWVRVKLPFLLSFGRGDTMCVGQSYKLMASGAEKYIWSPATFLDNPTIANPVSTPDSSVVYRVIGYDTLGCFADTEFVAIKVYPIPKVDILEDKITVSAGSSLQLHSNVSSDVTNLHWSPALGLSCVNCPNPTASPKEDMTYTLTVTNGGGCSAKDNVDLLIVCSQGNVYIPNTFSPNNDGVNDVFYPRGKGIYGIKAMRVFSRWGELLYEKTNFQPNDISSGWDGGFKGKKLAPDVYVYIIEVVCDNNQLFTLKGNITLLK